MPFYPYRHEEDQATGLAPRKGWACDISANAPVVYRQGKIVERADFDRERAALIEQAAILRHYADHTLQHYPEVMARLLKAAQHPAQPHFILSFRSFLRYDRNRDPVTFAKAQHPVLTEFAAQTANRSALAEYHAYYQKSAEELAWFAQRASNLSETANVSDLGNGFPDTV